MSNQTQTTTNSQARESDGRFALQMESKRSVARWAKRDAEREARRQEIIAEYGSDDLCWA